MKEALTIISLAVGIVSVLLIVVLNYKTLNKLRKAEDKERVAEKSMQLSEAMEETEYGKKVIAKLNEINESQSLFSQSLLHILRTDLLTTTDEIFYINRKRNTQSSKWSSLNERLRRLETLEEIMDECYDSYLRLGGNHSMADRYREAKSIILETQRAAEQKNKGEGKNGEIDQ